jgi:hypothetical protein
MFEAKIREYRAPKPRGFLASIASLDVRRQAFRVTSATGLRDGQSRRSRSAKRASLGTGFARLSSSTAPAVPRTSACGAAHGAVARGALIVLMHDLAFVKLRPRAEILTIVRFVRWHAL